MVSGRGKRMELIKEIYNEVDNKNITENNSSDEMLSKIIKVLQIFEISSIISIDDSWTNQSYEELDKIISHIPDFKFKENVERVIDNEDISDIDSIKKGLENKDFSTKDSEILTELYNKYIVRTEIYKEPTLKVLDKVLIELKEKCKHIEIIKENKQLKDEDIKKYENINSLFILDRNMSKSFGQKDSILDSILQLKKNNASNLILIYSNECKNDFDTHENKMKLLNERNIFNDEEQISIIYQLWAIDKTTDYNEFLDKFVENLYNCAFGKSIYNILGVRNNAIKDVFKEIKQEDIKSYMPMFEAAYIEGDTIISGYSKIIDALYNKYMEKRHYDDIKESYKFLIDFEKSKIENSSKIKIHKETERKYGAYRLQHVKTQMRNILKNSEKYRVANYLNNKLYKDISLGDIIVYTEPNNKLKFGVVISRECDCVIRIDKVKETPRRALEEYTVLLLEHSELTEKLIDDICDKDYFNKHILPISYNGKLYSLKPTEKVRQFSTFILDLCSLSDIGQAIINYKDDFKAYKSYHSEIYYKDEFGKLLNDEMSKYDIYNYIAKEENIKILRNKLVSYDYGVKFENEKFSLERICRLESKRTVLTIQNYIHNISLIGADTPIVNESIQVSEC